MRPQDGGSTPPLSATLPFPGRTCLSVWHSGLLRRDPQGPRVRLPPAPPHSTRSCNGAQGGIRTHNTRPLRPVRLPIAPPGLSRSGALSVPTLCPGRDSNPQHAVSETAVFSSFTTRAHVQHDDRDPGNSLGRKSESPLQPLTEGGLHGRLTTVRLREPLQQRRRKVAARRHQG